MFIIENTIIEFFVELNDPRREHKKLYSLIEIIFLTITAVLSGADCFTTLHKLRKSVYLVNFLKNELYNARMNVLVDVNIEAALKIAIDFCIYAYDAYYLECAKRYNSKLLTLDKK